jgi:hypothetical protein
MCSNFLEGPSYIYVLTLYPSTPRRNLISADIFISRFLFIARPNMAVRNNFALCYVICDCAHDFHSMCVHLFHTFTAESSEFQNSVFLPFMLIFIFKFERLICVYKLNL